MGNQARASEKPSGPETRADRSDVPLSVCVITLNEEDNIRRCLSSVQWADEIVVVDSGSDDRTRGIAEAMGARVLHHEWPGHREQKQYATDRASHDWVLSLDADEKLDDELARSVRSVFEGSPPDPGVCFEVNRLAEYLGEWMYHGSWHPDWIVRLFNRTRTEWGGRNPHDRVLPAAEVRRLDGLLLHWPYEDISDHIDHINDYTTIMARELDDEGVTGGPLRGLLHGAAAWFKDYLLKGGFRGGRTGLLNSILHAFYTTMKYVKLWERQQDFEADDPDPPSQDASG